MTPIPVRVVGSAERRAVSAMLARAFANDPAMAYIFPDPAIRARRLPMLFALLFDEDALAGMRLAVPGALAATLWRAPGHVRTPRSHMIAQFLPLLRLFGTAIGRALAISEAIDAHSPREPCWYLHIAGCDPARQGRGLGRAVVQSGLSRIAGGGLPCYLETATEANLSFYAALGFEVTGDWRVGGAGPVFWSMMRRV